MDRDKERIKLRSGTTGRDDGCRNRTENFRGKMWAKAEAKKGSMKLAETPACRDAECDGGMWRCSERMADKN